MAQQRAFPEEDVERTVLRSIVKLVPENGGRIVLYRMPISSVFRAPYVTELGKQAGETMARALVAWRVPTLVPEIDTSDEDFPDLWHLRASRAAEFSRSLARAFAAWDRDEQERGRPEDGAPP